jgi:hypothetical protein
MPTCTLCGRTGDFIVYSRFLGYVCSFLEAESCRETEHKSKSTSGSVLQVDSNTV